MVKANIMPNFNSDNDNFAKVMLISLIFIMFIDQKIRAYRSCPVEKYGITPRCFIVIH